MKMKTVIYDLNKISISMGILEENIRGLNPEEYTIAGRKKMMGSIDTLRSRFMKLPIIPLSKKQVK